MLVCLSLEASQPHGKSYRLVIGCGLHPSLVSMIAAFMRLF